MGTIFSMHDGMGGPHLFNILVGSNDPVEPVKILRVKAVYPPNTPNAGGH